MNLFEMWGVEARALKDSVRAVAIINGPEGTFLGEVLDQFEIQRVVHHADIDGADHAKLMSIHDGSRRWA